MEEFKSTVKFFLTALRIQIMVAWLDSLALQLPEKIFLFTATVIVLQGVSKEQSGPVLMEVIPGQSNLVFAGSHAYSSITSGRPGTKSEGMIYHHFEGGPKNGGGSAVAKFNLSWILGGEKLVMEKCLLG